MSYGLILLYFTIDFHPGTSATLLGHSPWLTLQCSNYVEHKLQENLDSEIMQVLLEEARESYDMEIVVELRSDNSEDIESNVDRIEAWIKSWQHNNPESATKG